jgi:hypothetical protein
MSNHYRRRRGPEEPPLRLSANHRAWGLAVRLGPALAVLGLCGVVALLICIAGGWR